MAQGQVHPGAERTTDELRASTVGHLQAVELDVRVAHLGLLCDPPLVAGVAADLALGVLAGAAGLATHGASSVHGLCWALPTAPGHPRSSWRVLAAYDLAARMALGR